MKFEKLSESNGKGYKMFLYGFLMCAVLLIIINMFLTKAKYKVVDSAKLVNSTINYSSADLNVIAMYVKDDDTSNYKPIEEVPKGDYIIVSNESYCITKDSEDKVYNIMEYKNNKVYIEIDKKGSKCYVYLKKSTDKSETTLGNLSLTVNTTEEGCPAIDPSTGNATISKLETADLLCEGQDDYGSTYYFRGAGTHNWVMIGGTYWRIIRINGNGTIRLLYNGMENVKVGASATMAYGGESREFNSEYNDNKYVGLSYGGYWYSASESYVDAHKNGTSSDMLNLLYSWYTTEKDGKSLNLYKKLIDGSTGFCGDRELSSGEGYGTNTTYYAAYSRLESNPAKPTFKCTNKSRDLYTTRDETGDGNGVLLYPVGLITADEIVYAGSLYGKSNEKCWLNNQSDYWGITPKSFDVPNYGDKIALVYIVGSSGSLSRSGVGGNYSQGIRPVINLKADTKFIKGGDGTIDKPFIVSLY